MKKGLNNKGYSLVELLLTLAIFGLVMIGIAMIMRTTSVSYRDGSNEVTMQTEAQIVANQIEEIFMDGTGGYDSGVSGTSQYFCITSDGASHFVIYKPAEQEVWYEKINATGVTSPSAESAGTWSLMAENVASLDISGFSVSDTSDNMITVKVSMDRDGYTYTATKDVYFRNSIENQSVTMLDTNSSSSGSSGMAFQDIYIERYEVFDLCKELGLDINQTITITGLSSSNYKLVIPSYSTGNKDTYNAITSISNAAGADTTAQINACKTAGYMAITPTDTLNLNTTGSVTNTANVTITATDTSGNPIRVRLLTKPVKYVLEDNPTGPDGIILLTAANTTMPRYTWVTVEGINFTDMVHIHGKTFRYTMAIYYDTGNNRFSTSEKKSGNVALYTIDNSQLDFDYAVGPNGGANNFAYQLNVAMAPDPESGDLLINIPSPVMGGYATDLSSGNARIAFVIELPHTTDISAGTSTVYNVVDMVLLYQTTGMNINLYDGGYSDDVNADYLGSNPFATP